MDFYTQSKYERPKRLSEKTRQFAYDSLKCKFGLETENTKGVSLDDYDDFESLSNIKKYDIAIREISKKAPIRICDGELLSGAATLGPAIRHAVPALYNDKIVITSVSHLTVDFETVLKLHLNLATALRNFLAKQHLLV